MISHILYKGLIFNSKYFEGDVEVLAINEDKNELKVKITRSSENWHFEDWNLQHTFIGFQQGSYFKKQDNEIKE